MIPGTVEHHHAALEAAFLRLSRSRQRRLRREAEAFIMDNLSCADHNNFWRGLSARQVIAASCGGAS